MVDIAIEKFTTLRKLDMQKRYCLQFIILIPSSSFTLHGHIIMRYYDSESPQYKLIVLAKNLKSSGYGINDHIPFLENQIREQLADIKKILIEKEQVEIFSQFETEFEGLCEAENLTYKYWILLGYRLSIFLTSPPNRTISNNNQFTSKVLDTEAWRSHTALERLCEEANHNHIPTNLSLISEFPRIILLPSTLGDFPIGLMRDLLIFNALPLGLITTDIIADGYKYYPDLFYMHDMSHASIWFSHSYQFKAKNTIAIFLEYVASIIHMETDRYKKSQLEFIIFYLTHEATFFIGRVNADHKSFDKFMESETFLYERAANDRYYGSLIKPHLRKEFPESDSLRQYLDEANLMMRDIISEFFNKYDVPNFYFPIKIRRNYLIETPLTESEISKHWSNAYFNTELPMLLGGVFYSSDFYHFLVRKDKGGPHFSGSENTHFIEFSAHIEKMQEKFQHKKMKPQHSLTFFSNPEVHKDTENYQLKATI